MKTQFTKTLLILTSFTFVLSACGGGGGGGGGATQSTPATSESNTQVVSPIPTPELVVAAPTPEPTPEVVPTPEPVNYSPSEILLTEDAGNSQELYVEESFNFSQERQVELTLSAKNEEQALANKLVKIKAIPLDVTAWDDSRISNANLLQIVRLDGNGKFEKTITVPYYVEKLLLEINVIGIENRAMLDISQSAQVTVDHAFN